MQPKTILEEMDRNELVLMYVIGIMEDLRVKGLVEGGPHEFTFKGDQTLAALRASGFKPTDEEMREAVHFLTTPQE